MAILNGIELSTYEKHKIADSLNETETEILQSEIMLKEQAEDEKHQKRISRSIAVTVISVSCAVLVFWGIGMIIFANIFAPQH